jgi:excisionase family DNA binding protein
MKKKEAKGMSDLISIAEAARVRGVSYGAIRDLVDRGRLAVVEVGGRRFVSKSAVRSFKAEKGGRGRKASGTDGKVKVKKGIQK